MQEPVSTDPRLLYRRTDPDTSAKSAPRRGSTPNAIRVLEVIRSFGSLGCTQDDVFEALDVGNEAETGPQSQSSINGQFNILEKQRLIVRPGEERIGCRLGGKQLVMYALDESEQTAALMNDRLILEKVLSPQELAALYKWYDLQQQAEKLAQEAEAWKNGIIKDVLGITTNGEYVIALDLGYKLKITVKPKSTNMEIKKGRI